MATPAQLLEIRGRLMSLAAYAEEIHQAAIGGETVQGRAGVLAKQLHDLVVDVDDCWG